MRLIKFLLIFLYFFPLAANADEPCSLSAMKFVHSPRRLKILEGCVTIRGIVVRVPPSNPWDGDRHVDIKPDPEFEHLMNGVNRKKGYLVVEFICQGPIILKKEARRVCAGYKERFRLPKVGDYVETAGIHVEDLQHGHNEIHPGERLLVLREKAVRR